MALSASAVYAAARTQQQPPSAPAAASSGSAESSPADSVAGVADNVFRQAGDAGSYTPTALSRWSLLDHKLPAADAVKSIHIYDFDNTLFKTPVPNPRLWNAATLGNLMNNDFFSTGGWWHDVRILSATGEGVAKEEPRAWAGWWNEQVVELARLSAQEPGALGVLLTGRAERAFGDLVQRMAKAKGLRFDMVTLKPAVGPNNQTFASTMSFKQAFLEAVMETYPHATEIRIYEDRPRHVEGFRTFLARYNAHRQARTQPPPLPPISGEVIAVAQQAKTLDPVVEVAEVQHMVNCHNAAWGGSNNTNGSKNDGKGRRHARLVLNKTVFFTGYLISEADSQRLLALAQPQLQPHLHRRDFKYHGNSIMISPRQCPPHVLAKTGGMGSTMRWRVEALGSLDNGIWAVKVVPAMPAGSGAVYYTAEAVPLVVLAVCHGLRPYEASRIRSWQPVAADDVFEFDTTVGEKAILRVDTDHQQAPSADETNSNSNSHGHNSHAGQGHAKRMRVGPGPYSTRGRGGGASSSNTTAQAGFAQQHGFAPPTGPRAAQGGGGGGRGYYAQGAGVRGGGGSGRGGAFRGGRGGGAYGGGAAGNAGKPRAHGYYQYQSLDDAGPSQAPAPAQNLPRQKIVYDEA